MEEVFNEDYFECGVEKKLSGYTNYRYMPTRSYEEATSIANAIKNNNELTILDWGCAKGYLVHALRQLGFKAKGYDISEYAIANCHPSVTDFVTNDIDKVSSADLIICKDVMEHVPEEEVLSVLKQIRYKCIFGALFVIPLGDDNKFRIREYEMDVTHVTKKDEDWWIDKFREAGFKIDSFSYSLGSIKKKWQGYEYGNGFFWVDRR